MSRDLRDPLDPERDFYVGEPGKGPELVWYVDYTFRHADRGRAVILRAMEYLGETGAVIAIRQNPAGSRRPESECAARAAVASGLQQRFLDMHAALTSHRGSFDRAAMMALARDQGLDMERFEADFDCAETAERIAADKASAARAGGNMTPLLFINGRLYLGAWDEVELIEAVKRPLGLRVRLAADDFFHWAASGGLVLLLATLAALLVANIGLHDAYEQVRDTDFGFTWDGSAFALPLEQWINDGLMAVFFLIVGIEIKRELVDGELSDPARAALPIIGAIGGMAAPALIYTAFNFGTETAHGWGIPMATDIAFTLGLMALLGRHVPTSLKIFVSALAIADDLGAILVIAAFYGDGLETTPLVGAVVVLAVMALLNRTRVYARTPYLILGVVLWGFVHASGLHATLAGVLTAIAIPSRRSGNLHGVAAQTAAVFEAELDDREEERPTVRDGTLSILENALERLREPGVHLQRALESWSTFLILPLFAFFNTGIAIGNASFSISSPEVLGVVCGLAIGKPLGIFTVCWVSVKLGITRLSPEIRWSQMLGAGCLAGVGFTMSIFIAAAAFSGEELEGVKLAILLASTASAAVGMGILWAVRRRN
ncbi:Na+/H+ antiporter NhaA (plasmid) [Paroceanicella profunda]|uniref:Na(+)/H(+) antiporter NhaA n=1 Tax=Paroceanicella profunda TaxID=2579971 RepID=A0A5B8G5N0_9RHOB|nr:Na+/H+ antiporter NhaA [Paroceanicella profunda]QDL94652.1 Na+/H+ antiporter NhaA [Paroceanicella profunda]